MTKNKKCSICGNEKFNSFIIWRDSFYGKTTCPSCNKKIKFKNKALILIVCTLIYAVFGIMSGKLFLIYNNMSLLVFIIITSIPIAIFVTSKIFKLEGS